MPLFRNPIEALYVFEMVLHKISTNNEHDEYQNHIWMFPFDAFMVDDSQVVDLT